MTDGISEIGVGVGSSGVPPGGVEPGMTDAFAGAKVPQVGPWQACGRDGDFVLNARQCDVRRRVVRHLQ